MLVGVSRTSKTPLSIYLGYLGYKTANVPLVKGIEPPAELFTIDQSKVVGLTIDATRLSEIRGERIRWMRGDRKYADLVEIYDELEYATQVHRRLGCPVLEVSELSIEEISHRIIQLVERREGRGRIEAEAPGSDVALGAPGTRRSAPRSSSSTGSSRRSGSGSGRSRGWRSTARDVAAVPGRLPPPMANRYVYDFDEPSTGGRELLGGKGIGLAEMTLMGVPVPAGFTITTDACRAYMAAGGELPDGLEEEVDEHVRRLEERTGKRFGSSDDPLLVSVRSGAAVSMPGMMDTILNLGLNDDAAEGLAVRDRATHGSRSTRTGG